ncbi:MAG TPA: hypothetical protein PK781_06465 [Terrimesophilobacter sp.]|nr:hypothetical protein [Terrimesophilobacter sp.]HRQ00086.1 hypothetical protein [Terrimesophilobacter sp.]
MTVTRILCSIGVASLLIVTPVLAASAAVGSWDPPITLSDAGGEAVAPQLVTDGSTITAVWQRNDGSDYRIRASSSTDGGVTWSTTPVTLSDAGGDAVEPQLVTDGSTITAIWRHSDGSDDRIQVSSFTAVAAPEPGLAGTGISDAHTLTLTAVAALFLIAGGAALGASHRGRDRARPSTKH